MDPPQFPSSSQILDFFLPDNDDQKYQGPTRVSYAEDLNLDGNCILQIDGKLKYTSNLVIKRGVNDRFTVKWTGLVSDDPSNHIPGVDTTTDPPITTVYLTEVNCLVDEPTVPQPGIIQIPTIGEADSPSHTYSCGAKVGNPNRYNSVVVIPKVNTYTLQFANTSESIWDGQMTVSINGGAVSFAPILPVNASPVTAGTLFTVPANANQQNQQLNCLDSSVMKDSFYDYTSTDLVIDYVYGQGWLRSDPWLSTQAAFLGLPIFSQRIDVEDEVWFHPFADATSLRANANSTVAFQEVFAREYFLIYDATLNPEPSVDSPVIFPVNNSPFSYMNPSLTHPTASFVPEIGHFYGGIGNNYSNMFHAWWPTPMDQITEGSPNGLTPTNLTIVSNPPTVGTIPSDRDQCNFINGPTYGPLTKYYVSDYCAGGAQAFHGQCDWPISYSPAHNTTQVANQFCARSTSVYDNQWLESGSSLTCVPSGYCSRSRRVTSMRYAFIFENTPEKPSEYTKLKVFTEVVTIPPGAYSLNQLLLAMTEAFTKVDTNGESTFVKYIDPHQNSMMFVASDYVDDSAPWTVPSSNASFPNGNAIGPSIYGHVGRGVSVFAGPNRRMKVGSGNVSITIGPDNSRLQIGNGFDTYAVFDQIPTSTLVTNQPFSAVMAASYNVPMWCPPNYGDTGYAVTVPAADAPIVQETPVDQAFLNVTYAVAPFDRTNVQYYNNWYPNPWSRDSGVWNHRLAKRYDATNLVFVSNTRGREVTHSSAELAVLTISGGASTDPLTSSTAKLSCKVNFNPYIRGTLTGPNGLRLLSLCDGSTVEKNFWSLLGFSSKKLETLWTPKIGAVLPIDGLYWNPNEEKMEFSQDAYPISNRSPWLNHTVSPYVARATYKDHEIGMQEHWNNIISTFPQWNISVQPGVVFQTNCPVLVPTLLRASVATIAVGQENTTPATVISSVGGLYTLPQDVFQIRASMVSDDPETYVVGVNSDLVALEQSHGSLTSIMAYNPYTVHDTTVRTIGRGLAMLYSDSYDETPLADTVYQTFTTPALPNLWNSGLTTISDVDHSVADTSYYHVPIPGSSSLVAYDRVITSTTEYYGCHWDFVPDRQSLYAGKINQSVMYTMMENDCNVTFIETMDLDTHVLTSTPTPFIRNASIRDQGYCMTLTSIVPFTYGLTYNPPSAGVYMVSSPLIYAPPGPAQTLSDTTFVLNNVVRNRVPGLGVMRTARVAPYYVNTAPLLTQRGYMGLPTYPMMNWSLASPFTKEVYDGPTVPAKQYQSEISKIESGSESTVVAFVMNYDPNDTSSLSGLFQSEAFFPGGTATVIDQESRSSVTQQRISPSSGADYSQAIQTTTVSRVIEAVAPPSDPSSLTSSGAFLFGVRFNRNVSLNTAFIKGKRFQDYMVMQVQPAATNEQQAVPFAASRTYEIPKCSIREVEYSVLGLDGQELLGVQGLSVQLNFTPLNGPTSLQQAFSTSTALSAIQAAEAPTLTSLGANAVQVRAQPPPPSQGLVASGFATKRAKFAQ